MFLVYFDGFFDCLMLSICVSCTDEFKKVPKIRVITKGQRTLQLEKAIIKKATYSSLA